MLDDDLGIVAFGEPLEPVHRGQRLGAAGVERGHALQLARFVGVVEIAAEQDVARRELNQQSHMVGGVARQVERNDAPVAEHVDVAAVHRLDLGAFGSPRAERVFRALGPLEIGLADDQLRGGESGGLAGVVGVHMADPDDGDIGRLHAERRELFGHGDAQRRCECTLSGRSTLERGSKPRVPQQIMIHVADEIAAAGDRPRARRIFQRIREKGVEILDQPAAAVEPGDLDRRGIGSDRWRGSGGEQGGDEHFHDGWFPC